MKSNLKPLTVKVTIGICVKNDAELIKKAMASILGQSFPAELTELLIVDGCSRDGTLEIIKESLKGHNIRTQIFQENSGLGIARQIVVDKANGEYITWVDSDMVLPPNYIKNHVQFMDEHPLVGIAGGKYTVHLGNGLAADLENVVYAVDSLYGEKSVSKFGFLPGTEGSTFRVEAIRQVGGFDVRINGAAEDTEVAYRIKAKGWKIAIINEVFTESTRQSWLSLWQQYNWYGRGAHFIFHKDPNTVSIWKLMPLMGLFAGFLRFPYAYLLTKKKGVILLPFHYAYKRLAWFFGFFSAHLKGYGHFKNKANS